MIYSNTGAGAVYAMERARTGHYGENGFNDPRVCFCCDGCGADIHEGDTYYELPNGDIFCYDCMQDFYNHDWDIARYDDERR